MGVGWSGLACRVRPTIGRFVGEGGEGLNLLPVYCLLSSDQIGLVGEIGPLTNLGYQIV